MVTALTKSATTGPFSRNIQFLKTRFEDPMNTDAFFFGSDIALRAEKRPERNLADRKLSAKMHCLRGRPTLPPSDRVANLRPFARSVVYDLRRYTRGTFWGPYIDDSSATVDWEKMEAIMVLLAVNMENLAANTHAPHVFEPGWKTLFEGAVPGSYTAILSMTPGSESPHPSLSMKHDPYNITGTWMRVSCTIPYLYPCANIRYDRLSAG